MKIRFYLQLMRVVVPALSLAFLASSVHGTLVAYDPMSYSGSQINITTASPAGTPTQTTGGGFTGNWAGGALTWNATGLTYANLPTTGGSISSMGANNLYEAVSNAPTSGSVWVSFLFKQAGDNGGNRSGVILESSSGTGVMLSYQQFSGTQGEPCLMKMSATTTVGTQLTPDSSTLRTYTATNFYVLQFTYTNGVVSSISVYSNPTAGQATAPSADFTVSSGLPSMGALADFGLVDGSAEGISLDEFRVGTTFADVAGAAAPPVPTGLNAAATNNNTQVVLNWNVSAGATSYNVLRGTSSGNYTMTNTAASNSYTDTSNLVNGLTYYYVVQAVNSGGASANSTEASVMLGSVLPPPATPTGLTATAGTNSVSLIWNAAGGANGYNVLRGTTSGSYNVTNEVTSPTNFDNTAVGGTTYFYVVQAVSGVGVSGLSSEVAATPIIAAPTAPSGLMATPTNGQVALNWTAGLGAASYNVKRSATSGSETTISAAGAVTGTGYADATAVNGNVYYYEVSSTNPVGESANSGEVSAVMPPGTPTDPQVTPGDNQVSLVWTASSLAVSYNIKRSTTSGAEVTISVPGSVTDNEYLDDTAVSGTTYFYEISAVDASGEGANSVEVSALPTGATAAPTGLMATAGSGSVSLSWAAPAGSPTGYNVKRSTVSGAETILLPAGTNLSGTTFADTTVTAGTKYYYEVSALNVYGESPNSSEASATPTTGPAAYEPFDYPLGAFANGTASTATGFTGAWTTAGASGNIVAGLTYPGLPSANNAFTTTGGNQYESLSTPLSSGSVWISFLFQQSGDNGGNRAGLELLNSSGTGVMFAYHQSTAAAGLPSIDSVSGYTTLGTELNDSIITRTYNTANLYVLQLTYSAGALTSIAVYSDPTAGQGAAPAPDFTVTTGLSGIGAISAIGLWDATGEPITVDEWNVGSSFGAVVASGYVPPPPPPADLTAVPGDDAVDLTWMPVPGAGAYNVLRSTVSGQETFVASVTTTNYLDTGVTNGSTYFYEVNATNDTGVGADSSEVSATLVAPPPPTVLSASLDGTDTNLILAVNSQTGFNYVLLSTTNLAQPVVWSTNSITPGTGGMITNTAASRAQPGMFFKVFVSPVIQPPANLNQIASGSTNAIGLDWTASPSPGVTGYEVLYGVTTNSLTNSVVVGNVNSAVISGLTSGQTYYLSVIALAQGGQSLPAAASISAEPDTTVGVVPLFDDTTVQEPDTISNTPTALITWLADRPRARHARESQFMLYDHYLPFYWEQRMTDIQITDTVGKGGSGVTFNFSTLAALVPPNIRTFYLGVTTVAEYSDNIIANQNEPTGTNWSYTFTQNTMFNRPLQVGDRMEFEFSPFMVGPTNGQDNYYGGAILYIVGKGIVPWQEGVTNDPAQVNGAIDSTPMPTNGWIAGGFTMPYQYSDEPSNIFKQMSPNEAPASGQMFVLGRRLHETDFADGTHAEQPNPVFTEQIGKLGPKFANVSCVACHVNNGRALPPAIGALMTQSVVKVASDASGTPDPVLGSVLQPQSTTGTPEGAVSISSYTTTSGQYGDGTSYTLQKPNYTFTGHTPAFYSVRLAPQLVGMGLLEAVSESTVEALAAADNAGTNGISGRIQMVMDPQTGQPRLGRFGWKGGKARVSHQIAGALNTDMGVTTSIFPVLDGDTSSGPVELADSDLTNWTRYVSTLGVNARRNLTNDQALLGEQLFASANCVQCHTPTLVTSPYHPLAELRNQTIHPYTDLLLHDMGPGLADSLGEGVASGSQWRTPPLWSIGLTPGVSGGEAYLHDGRARTLEEAILWHDGEGAAAREAFRNMSATDRAALIAFLKSL